MTTNKLTPAKYRAVTISESSGNVFADLGRGNPERKLPKARLTLQIWRTIKERKLTQVRTGEVLGIQQPHVSSLMRGHSSAFPVERLMGFPRALGHDIDIAVTGSRKKRGALATMRPSPRAWAGQPSGASTWNPAGPAARVRVIGSGSGARLPGKA